MPKPITYRLSLELGTIAISRMVITTLYRMMYPFLPIIARGLGVGMGAVAIALAARSALALIIPSIGLLSDRWGRKKVLMLGQGLFIFGAFAIFLRPTYLVFFGGVLLASAAKFIFDLSAHAYAGDRVPYSRRGFVLAIVEGSWSGAFLLGVPLVGWLISRGDWVLPFPLLAISGLLMALLIHKVVPGTANKNQQDKIFLSLRDVLGKPSALAMMATMFLLHSGVQQLYISYGALLEDEFLVQVTALGAVSAAFGIAELGGQGLVAAITDRLGKWRAVMIGLIATTLGSLVLPLFMGGLLGAVLILFFVFLSFEFTVVSGLALMSELAPEARGSMMASNLAVIETANGLGILFGSLLFNVGILGVSLVSALLVSLAALSLYRGVQRN